METDNAGRTTQTQVLFKFLKTKMVRRASLKAIREAVLRQGLCASLVDVSQTGLISRIAT